MQRVAKPGLWAAISRQVGQVVREYSRLWAVSLRDTLGLVRTAAESGQTLNLLLPKPELKDRQPTC